MKIAFVRKNYTPFGGAERYLAQVIFRLLEMGHEVHIFAHTWDPAAGDSGETRGAPVFHRVPMIAAPSFLEALTFAFFSRRLLEEGSFDIIHSFERTLYQDVYRAGDGCHREWLIQRSKADTRIKCLTYPLNPLHRTLLSLERRLFLSPRLKKIIANSGRGKEEIIRHYGVPEGKIEVIYNGVDLEAFHPRNRALHREALRKELRIPAEGFVVFFLGSGFHRKGLAPLITAFSAVRPEIPEAFLIAAGQDRTAPYRRRALNLGLEERVIFPGPTRRAAEFYAASDLFALPTLYEPFSNACLEAMASGLPVLTSRQNGAGELIGDGENGLLADDPLDSSALAEKILLFYRSPDREAWGEGARRAASGLPIGKAAARLLEIYGELKGAAGV
jgi:UDP-glucose:(heptosyl)LPS alpha-1,3-glucosyltransferase